MSFSLLNFFYNFSLPSNEESNHAELNGIAALKKIVLHKLEDTISIITVVLLYRII